MNQHIGKNGNKSIIAYIIISFFLFQIAMIAFSTPVQGATTITVSLDGTKDYTSIQAAIDNASAGDTIYVYNGTYYEHLTIDKTLTLSGEQNTTTIIDGQQEEMSIVDITADNVNFSGFTLQNTSSSLSPIYCGVYIQSQSTNIYSNLISNTTYGITIINHNNKIFNNTFLYTARNIILIDTADNNTVYSNHISLNGPNRGFGIALSESSNNYIHHNTLMNGLFGLTLTSSNNNIFKHNIMENNSINFGITGSTISDYYNDIDTSNLVNELHIYYLINESDITIDSSSLAGIVYCINCTNMTIKDSNLHHAESGIAFFQTNHSHIENCTISRCDFGINLYDYAHNNTIKNNIVKNCTMDIAIGSYSSHNIINNNYIGWTINSPGLRVRDSDYNMITYNQFFNCKNAINIWNSKYTNIENNTINESRLEAILLYYDAYYCAIANNILKNNEIGLTLYDGIKFNSIYANNISHNNIGINLSGDGVPCTNNTFYHNDFFNNTLSAYDTFTNTWYNTTTKEGNYWSDYTGKEGSRKGIGDIPYNITGGSNQDLYPLVKPYEEPTSDLVFIMLVIAVILAIVFITIIAIFVRKK